jgi:hypothetical protein
MISSSLFSWAGRIWPFLFSVFFLEGILDIAAAVRCLFIYRGLSEKGGISDGQATAGSTATRINAPQAISSNPSLSLMISVTRRTQLQPPKVVLVAHAPLRYTIAFAPCRSYRCDQRPALPLLFATRRSSHQAHGPSSPRVWGSAYDIPDLAILPRNQTCRP